MKNYINKLNGIKKHKRYKECIMCGRLIEDTVSNKKYCNSCWKEIEQENNRKYAREGMRRLREDRNVKGLENPKKC